MLSLDELRQRLAAGQYRLSEHALARVVERNISESMIRAAGADAELLEDYPTDKYSPSCLLLGFTAERVALHIQVSRQENPKVKIITVYFPDPGHWVDARTRKGQS
ncbi:MAG: DUF4258 domain-containing protein [Planctomycetes bacterium]|nr:DUF4258 domain-containing protein [Planctomycetota bacterium]